MILVHQRYFAKPDLRDQVFRTRVEASHRLLELGVPVGQIWVPAREDPGMPDVIWSCTYPTMEDRERVRALQESDPAFQAIRMRQGTQVQQFVREHYRLHPLK